MTDAVATEAVQSSFTVEQTFMFMFCAYMHTYAGTTGLVLLAAFRTGLAATVLAWSPSRMETWFRS